MGTRHPSRTRTCACPVFATFVLDFLPNVAACHAMANLPPKHNLLARPVVVVAATSAGIGLDALPPVRAASVAFDSKRPSPSLRWLTTGVTVPQWSSILMLRNLEIARRRISRRRFACSPRGRSRTQWRQSKRGNPKPICLCSTLRRPARCGSLRVRHWPVARRTESGERGADDLVVFLPVLAYDGANMTQIDAGGIPDIAMAGTSTRTAGPQVGKRDARERG